MQVNRKELQEFYRQHEARLYRVLKVVTELDKGATAEQLRPMLMLISNDKAPCCEICGAWPDAERGGYLCQGHYPSFDRIA